jgi:hypothetical protein
VARVTTRQAATKTLAARAIGTGRPEIHVVDGFFAKPAAVRRHALTLPFRLDAGGYPGERARIHD